MSLIKPISIAQRLRPFTQLPGTSIPLPGSSLAVTCFPTKLYFYSLFKSENVAPLFEVPLAAESPIENFTCQLDLEQPSIRIWGTSRQGIYFRYRIYVAQQSREVVIVKERSADQQRELRIPLPATETVLEQFPAQVECLALGSHRSQNWVGITQRVQLAEFLPPWMHLAQLLPVANDQGGGASLLSDCLSFFRENEKTNFWRAIKDLFVVGTNGILSPKKTDDGLWGFPKPPLPQEEIISRLAYFSASMPLLKKCFISLENSELKILDMVSEELHCGKMTGVILPGVGQLDFEWSKKQLRRMVMRIAQDSSLTLYPGKGIKKFRMRSFYSGAEKERIFNTFTLELRQGMVYGFDRFE